ncbi:type VI secretion system protein [Luteimonas sp. BDR2-5]|uniref:type VI secretion system protein n=1 Tax=Proluteimonas luteida TaxID=2878685 RepID=UPI001E64B807|nr:type VI secretion system protein [Luteimonas sp. BDR2-5]MCD9029082.1 type VI secretion system protein [Luteimonas sp. BDR2-5]
MSLLARFSGLYARVPGLSWIARLQKPLLRNVLAVAVALVLALLLVWVLIGLLPLVPGRFWQLAGLCLIGFAVLWWFLVGAKRYSRRGFSNKRIGDLGPGNPDDEREPLARMRAAIAEAKGTIRRSPDIDKGRDPLYRVPWLLFLGDADADTTALLASASRVSPFPPPTQAGADPDPLWRWWFFRSMIAIQMHARVVCEPGARLDRGLWYQALQLLRSERDKLALNGIVVCVSAQTLLGSADQVKAAGIRLRRLVDEAMEHLQIRPPVYFVVTGLDQLHGYADFRAALPAEAFEQALGFRLADSEVVSAATSGRLDDILGPVVERLHALRETALRSQSTPDKRRGVFEFVQAFPRMADGLRIFVDQLLADNPFQRTPRWRGLYFAGGGGAGHAGGAFVADLFTRFLPSDQPLATPSLKGSAGRMTGAGLGVAAMLGLSAYLSYGLFTAWQEDTQLLAQTRAACQETQGSGAGGRIAWVAACGRTIQQLEAAAAGTSLGFGIRRSDRDIDALKARVVEDFSRLILAPYDQMLGADLARGEVGLDHALAVAQRLRLLDRCRRQRAECEQEAAGNVVFDAQSRLFAPFQSGDGDIAVNRERAAALFDTYLGYLRWQHRGMLNDEQQRLLGEFEKIAARYQPRPADLEQWAAARRDPVRLADYWLPADRVVGVEAGSLPEIPAAYTRETWDGVVAPWLATVADRLPARAAATDAFRADYFGAYFAAWGAFQARFLEGAQLWRGHYDELAVRAGGADNPYRFFFDSAQHHLFGLPLKLGAGGRWANAWAAARSDWLRGWRPIGGFLGQTVKGWFGGGPVVEPPPWLPAMQQSLRDVLARQQPLYAKAYLQLEADGAGQEMYRIAAAFYQARGRPADGPGADYAELLQSLEKPDEQAATEFSGADMAAWSVVQGPARLLLLLTVQRAAQYVQTRWNDSVVQPMAALPAHEQVDALYGAQGKLDAFVNDWLAPFITERERTPVEVGGIALPLSSGFQDVVSGKRQFMPLLGEDKPFMAGNFVFAGPSQAGALREAPEGTVLEIDCKERLYRAVSNAPSLAEAKASVFWSPQSCVEARIRIALQPPDALDSMMDGGAPTGDPLAAPPAAAAEPALQLTRIYSGPEGFRELVEDFSDGVQDYPAVAFRDAYTPAQWSELVPRLREAGFSGVRVLLQVEPTDELNRYLSARDRPASVPASIVDQGPTALSQEIPDAH